MELPGEVDCGKVIVHVFPHPFSDDESSSHLLPVVGRSIAEVIGDLPCLVPVLNGEVIEEEDYSRLLAADDSLVLRRIPAKSDTARLILQAAVVVLSIYTGGAVGAAYGAAWGAVAGAAVSIIGNLAINALIPPTMPSFDNEEPRKLSFLTGTNNRVASFLPIPVPYGLNKWYPPIPMTALPYTELVGDDQYFRALLVLGYGPLEIGGVSTDDGLITQDTVLTGSPITVDNTAVENFTDVQFEIGYWDEVSLYRTSIVEDQLNLSLPRSTTEPTSDEQTIADTATHTRTTSADTSEVSLDVFFPALFSISKNGNTRLMSVLLRVECRPFGSSGSWTMLDNNWVISSGERNPVRIGRHYTLPSTGTWDIKLSRISTFIGRKNEHQSDGAWINLRSIQTGTIPFAVPNVLVMALRIKATDQLGGRLDGISVKATRILPVWNGSAWVEEATRNPAWAYADVFTGNATRKPISKDDLDKTVIKAWADWCDTNGMYLDTVIDADGTVFDRGRDVASSGLGAWTFTDTGKVSVVTDIPTASTLLISPRTTSGFKQSMKFIETPHGLRVKFTDPDRWEATERFVYADGYDDENATKFESLNLFGVTDPDQAWKIGRYHLAQMILRPETYEWTDEFRHLMYARGNTLDLSHQIIRVGLQSARVKEVFASGTSVTSVKLDEYLVMESGEVYGLRIQRKDGVIIVRQINNVNPGTDQPTFSSSIAGVDFGEGTDTAVHVGDQVVFGIFGEDIIKAKITKIEPQRDFQARITAVPAADDIYDAWDGTIPTFDPVISHPVSPDRIAPPIPEIQTVVADYTSSTPDADGSLRLRVAVSYTLPPGLSGVLSVEASIRRIETVSGTDYQSQWVNRGEAPANGIYYIKDVEQTIIYEIRLRSKRGELVSSWSDSYEYEIPDFGLRKLTANVYYDQQNVWRKDPSGDWTPSDYITLGTVEFKDELLNIVSSMVLEATLDPDTGLVTVVVDSEDGEAMTETIFGDGTGNVSIEVSHDDTDTFAALSFVSVLSGVDGVDGTSITILGTLADVADLPASGNTVGDAYIIDGDLWVWTADLVWENVGTIQGPAGADGISVAELTIYKRATSTPATPTGGSYNFGTQVLTPPSGWSSTIPAGTDPVYTSRGTAVITGATGTFSSFTWSTPILTFSTPTDGVDGEPAVSLQLTRASATLFAYANGNIPDFADAVGNAKLYQGETDITSLASFSASASGCTGTVNTATNTPVSGQAKGYYRVTALPGDTGSLTITATYNGKTYTAVFSVSKAKGGYEIVSSLPTTGNFEGRVVFLTTDGKLYRYTSGAWTAAVPSADVTGQLIASQIADAAITTAKFANGIRPVEIVSSLPSTGNVEGRLVYLTTDDKLYRYTGSAWTTAIAAVDISGQIVAAQIADAAINTAKFAAGITPVEIVSVLPSSGNFAGRLAYLTTDSKLYRHNGTSWITAVAAVDITGQMTTAQIADAALTAAKFASGIRPVEIVASLPSSGNFEGRMAYLTTDDKLYRHNGTSWVSAVAAADITGQVSDAQIAGMAATKMTGQITSTQITDSAVSAAKIAAGAIIAGKIAAGAIAAADIAAGAIIAGKIAANAVTATEIAANAITAGKIAAGAVSATQLAADAVVAGKIAAGAVTAGTIAAGVVTATELAAGSVVAGKIAAGAVSTTELAALAVTSAKIAAGSITADKMAANSVTAGSILAATITGDKIAANTITATNLAAASVTAGKIAAGAISASEIAAGAITATKMFIGETSNAYPDFDMVDPDFYFLGQAFGSFSFQDYGAGAAGVGKRRLIIAVNASAVYVYTKTFVLQPNSEYLVSGHVTRGSGSSGTAIAQLLTYTYTTDINNPTFSSFVEIASTSTANVNNYFTVSITTGSSIRLGRIAMIRTAGGDGSAVFGGFVVRRKNAGDLIVDGAITSNKIVANAITAGHISAAAVTTDKISAGAITAAKLASTELITLSAQIKDAIITSAKIVSLDVAKLTAGSLTASIDITTGILNITTGGAIRSGKYFYGDTSASGFYLGGSGGYPSFDIGNNTNYIRFRSDVGLTIGGPVVFTNNLQNNAVTVPYVFTPNDVFCPAGSETTILQTGANVVGDGTQGGALTNFYGIVDSGFQTDAACIIRLYISTGSGWVFRKSIELGVRTSGGDTYFKIPAVLMDVYSGAVTNLYFWLTCTPSLAPGGSSIKPVTMRGCVLSVLGTKR